MIVLLSIPFPNQDIITAIRADDARLVESLIDAQIRDNSPAKRHIWYADDIDLGYHRSPLLVAARYGAFAVSEMLLKKVTLSLNLLFFFGFARSIAERLDISFLNFSYFLPFHREGVT